MCTSTFCYCSLITEFACCSVKLIISRTHLLSLCCYNTGTCGEGPSSLLHQPLPCHISRDTSQRLQLLQRSTHIWYIVRCTWYIFLRNQASRLQEDEKLLNHTLALYLTTFFHRTNIVGAAIVGAAIGGLVVCTLDLILTNRFRGWLRRQQCPGPRGYHVN